MPFAQIPFVSNRAYNIRVCIMYALFYRYPNACFDGQFLRPFILSCYVQYLKQEVPFRFFSTPTIAKITSDYRLGSLSRKVWQ